MQIDVNGKILNFPTSVYIFGTLCMVDSIHVIDLSEYWPRYNLSVVFNIKNRKYPCNCETWDIDDESLKAKIEVLARQIMP